MILIMLTKVFFPLLSVLFTVRINSISTVLTHGKKHRYGIRLFNFILKLKPKPGHFTPLLAERVTQTLKFAGQLPKKTTEMQQLPNQRQAEILGLLLGGHTIQNRTRLSSGNENF